MVTTATGLEQGGMENPVELNLIHNALIVEDMPDARAWLSGVLQSAFDGIVIHAVPSLTDARKYLLQRRPSIALIDLHLPDGSGVDIISELRRRYPDTHIVVASIFDDDEHVFPALRAGANGYLLKEQSHAALVKLLRGMIDGEPPLSPAIARKMLGFFVGAQSNVGDDVVLARREEEVLRLIAKGYKLAAVAEMLKITRHTVAGYVKSIYRKLNVSSRAEATLEAARRGIVDPR